MAVNSRAVRVTAASRWLCLAGATLGAVGLLGWMLGWPALYTLLPGQPAMMPNSGVALVLCGAAALTRLNLAARPVARRLATIAGVFVVLLGLATAAEYLWHID